MLYSGNLYSKKLGTVENYYKEFSENKEFSSKSIKNVMKTLKINLLLAFFFFFKNTHMDQKSSVCIWAALFTLVWSGHPMNSLSLLLKLESNTRPIHLMTLSWRLIRWKFFVSWSVEKVQNCNIRLCLAEILTGLVFSFYSPFFLLLVMCLKFLIIIAFNFYTNIHNYHLSRICVLKETHTLTVNWWSLKEMCVTIL